MEHQPKDRAGPDTYLGEPFLNGIATDPQRQARFSPAMADITSSLRTGTFDSYGLPAGRTIADIGGSEGSALDRPTTVPAADPTLAPATPLVTRVATENFTFQGVDIPASSYLALLVGAANTDPGVFGGAPFDITAQRPTQLTFGGGIHHCLGAGLARIEMREALPILASRLGDIALAGPILSRPPVGITGPLTLPLRFTGTDSRRGESRQAPAA